MSSSDAKNEAIALRIEGLVADGDLDAAGELVSDLHASDLADLMEQMDEAGQIALLSSLPVEVASEALAEMEDGEERGDLLAALENPASDDAYDGWLMTTRPTSWVNSIHPSRKGSSTPFRTRQRTS